MPTAAMSLPISHADSTRAPADEAEPTSSELRDYLAAADQLKAQIDGFAKLRHQVRWFPLFGIVTAPLGFLYAKWLALAIIITWLSFWSATLYITWMRTWQYKGELKRTRGEIARLRSELRESPAAS